MDIIVVGVYNEQDANTIEEMASANGLKLVWDYKRYNIEAEMGIVELKKYYTLYETGILIEGNYVEGDTFYSYPVIYEVSDYFIAREWYNKSREQPKLFNFFDTLSISNIQKMIIGFADEWDENTTVKIEKLSYKELKSRLYSPYVWCFGYNNLRTNSVIRDDFHPLVLELEKELD
ncbi:hypothetical protein [Emticicia sp. 21SJ11W-3]|uniref:hypothetical protein n=1 Tax=Emticicia sp. 21SJ11W-3 TaxID=2916755 RepID=UPI00209FB936|nr:hypothetical protein [Emticicia sp. 21SJ11W-3]UTA66506.1 hypothetical protein MB380_12940 [Emticicia sp. 21SJ11W-3]